MILGIGVDIIEIDRIKKAVEKPQFVARVFTDYEQEYYKQKGAGAETYAGIFAAKEAVSKALGTGIGKISFLDIEIKHTQEGKPQAVLHGNANQAFMSAGAARLHVSISHSKKYACAQALIET